MKGLMAVLGKPTDEDEDEGIAGTSDGDLEDAAQELIAAMKAGDRAGVAAAFRAMSDMCAMYSPESEDEA